MTISGGSLCAGTCRLTHGAGPRRPGVGVPGPTRRRQCSVPNASHSSHRYAHARIAANNSNTHNNTPPAVLHPPRLLTNVQFSTYTRYTTNRNTAVAQARWARAFHRRVAGSQTRLATTNPATAPST